jgi:ATP-dependent helicase HrpB
VLMTGGYGAVVGAESGVRDGEFLVAIDLQAGRRGEHADARIRIAAAVDRQWLTATSRETRHELGADGSVRATEREMYGALVLTERPVALDPSAATVILVDAFLDRPLAHADRVLLNRLRFARIPSDVRDLALRAAAGRTKLDDVQLENGLDWPSRQQIERDAPPWFLAPSGRTHRLEYRDDGSVVLSIKLQELFGVAATPVIGAARVPVLIELLAPNGRAVQTTRDLSSFWNSVYPEVRKELRGRYPRHPWPEDPWTAMPTARTAKRAARS